MIITVYYFGQIILNNEFKIKKIIENMFDFFNSNNFTYHHLFIYRWNNKNTIVMHII